MHSQQRQSGGPTQRVMVYCHDSVGVGHLRRSLAICAHVGNLFPAATFLLATGTPYVPLFNNLPRVDYIKLPALAKNSDGEYGSKFLSLSFDQIHHCRASLLLEAVRGFEPDVLLVDKQPLGVRGELADSIRWLKANRPRVRVVFGMRDVEDDADATIAQWERDGVQPLMETHFDEVWVYGQQDVFDVSREYRLSPAVRAKLRFLGYVSRGACGHVGETDVTTSDVLVTVGGGTDGEALLSAYLDAAAARVATLGYRSRIIGGPDLPGAARGRLKERADAAPRAIWQDFEACMSCRMRDCRMAVMMGGYNTMCEMAAQRKPMLVLPRSQPRMEQTIRARLWSQLGAARMLDPAGVTAASLADAVVDMLCNGSRTTAPRLDLNGLARVGERFGEFWQKEPPRAPALSMH